MITSFGAITTKGNSTTKTTLSMRLPRPPNPTNFVQAIYIHGRRPHNEILTAINTFSPLAGQDPKNLTLIKNAYGLIQRWEDKALIDEKLTTSHLTTTPRGSIWRKPACNCSKLIAPLRPQGGPHSF